MNREQQYLLFRMKELIRSGRYKFSARRDRPYLDDLSDLNISEEMAWKIIYSLNENYYFPDPKPNYNRSNDTLVFKRPIDKIMVYIKLQIIEISDGEYLVCLSFHSDERRK